MTDWIYLEPALIPPVIASVVLIIATLLIFIRLFGLRASSELSGFDFAVTIAFGSVMANVIMSEEPSVLHGVVAIAALFSVQFSVAWVRQNSDVFGAIVENKPRLIFHDGDFIIDQMRKAKVTEEDILGKIRTSGARDLDEVLAVIMERSGNVSVISHDEDRTPMDVRLLDGVQGWPGEKAAGEAVPAAS